MIYDDVFFLTPQLFTGKVAALLYHRCEYLFLSFYNNMFGLLHMSNVISKAFQLMRFDRVRPFCDVYYLHLLMRQ